MNFIFLACLVIGAVAYWQFVGFGPNKEVNDQSKGNSTKVDPATLIEDAEVPIKSLRVALLGDSFISRLPINEELPHTFLKHNYSGITAQDILETKLDAVVEDKPDLVILNAGNNDIDNERAPEDVAQDLISIYKYFKHHNIPCYIAEIFIRFYSPKYEHYTNGKSTEYYNTNCNKVHSILYNALPAKTLRHFPGMNNQEWISEDGVHLNQEGNEHLMKGFLETIKEFQGV